MHGPRPCASQFLSWSPAPPCSRSPTPCDPARTVADPAWASLSVHRVRSPRGSQFQLEWTVGISVSAPSWGFTPAIRALGKGRCSAVIAFLLCARPLLPFDPQGTLGGDSCPLVVQRRERRCRQGQWAQPVWDGAHPEPRCWRLRAWLFPTARGGQWRGGSVGGLPVSLGNLLLAYPPASLPLPLPGPPKLLGEHARGHHIGPSHTGAPPPGHLSRGRNGLVPWSQPVCSLGHAVHAAPWPPLGQGSPVPGPRAGPSPGLLGTRPQSRS